MSQDSLAFVTISYARDFERCQKLCQSIDRFAPNTEHVVIVNSSDLPLFSVLAKDKTRKIMSVEEVLPNGYHKLPFAKKWWLDPYLFPVRGWVLQQLTKLASAFCTDKELLVFLDSDLRLFRPLDLSAFYSNGKFRLHSKACDAPSPVHEKWLAHAEQVLGLEKTTFKHDYVGNIITWHRKSVIEMLKHIEATTKKRWFRALGHQLTISEYTLYGNYVERVQAKDSQHFTTQKPLCIEMWDAADIEAFFETDQVIDEHQCAVLIQSNLRFSGEAEDQLFDKIVSFVSKQQTPTTANYA